MAWDSSICVRTLIEVPSNRLNTEMMYPFAVDYEQIAKHVVEIGDPARPLPVGRRARPYVCRVCLRAGGTVRFRKVAHVIAQGWGNRPLQTGRSATSATESSAGLSTRTS